MTPRVTALYDANVLYPSLLRNLLMHLAVAGLVAARWTDTIHDEWGRNLLLDRPELGTERVNRIRTLMEQAVPDASVTGYEALIPTLSLPDPDDRHVLAAAIHAGADAIVTLNAKDFPAPVLQMYGLRVLTPDSLVLYLLKHDRSGTLEALKTLRASFRNPPLSWEELAQRLYQAGLERSMDETMKT